MRLFTEDRNAQLDDLLNQICESLQLNDDRRRKVEERYKAVAEWIEKDTGIFKNAKIYPQGSYRIGTTVKPRQGEEYDLDFVVQIDKDWRSIPFTTIIAEFKRRLEENADYKRMLEEKPRCIRLSYADDFHMDIIPSCTKSVYQNRNDIMVPDKKERSWVVSNPKDNASWYESKYIKVEDILLSNYSTTILMERAEELPEETPYQLKQPLQRATQLIKRYRDVFFEDDDEFAPSSIVLTTLCGLLYNGQNSIYGTVDGIINNVLEFVRNNPGKRIKVVNPINPEEDFTKEWDKDSRYLEGFIDFITTLNKVWQDFKTSDSFSINDKLKKSFGESYVIEALNRQGDFINSMRRNQKTSISKATGMASLAGARNTVNDRPNLFYGSKE